MKKNSIVGISSQTPAKFESVNKFASVSKKLKEGIDDARKHGTIPFQKIKRDLGLK